MGNKLITFWVAICYLIGFGNFGYGLIVGRTKQFIIGAIMMVIGFMFDKKFLMKKND